MAAQTTFIPGTESAGSGQDDVATTAFIAWTKEEKAGRYLDACLAALSAVASQAFYATKRNAPPRLAQFMDEVRSLVPPVRQDRILGPELERLARHFTSETFRA